MRNDEFAQAIRHMDQLWPGRFDQTPALMNIWRTVLDPYSPQQVIEAANDHAMYGRYAPKPVEMRDRLADQSRAEKSGLETVSTAVGLHEAHRRQWGTPNLTDAEVEAHACQIASDRYIVPAREAANATTDDKARSRLMRTAQMWADYACRCLMRDFERESARQEATT